jgi:hypothetical protein
VSPTFTFEVFETVNTANTSSFEEESSLSKIQPDNTEHSINIESKRGLNILPMKVGGGPFMKRASIK